MKSNFRLFATLAVAFIVGLMPARHATAQSAQNDVLTRDSVLRDPDVPVLGNPKGDVTIVEYFDYQCPYCKKAHPVVLQVAKEDGNVRLVFKDWPIFGDVSKYAARMALAAKFQGKYEQAHAALLNAKSKLSEASVGELLSGAGVDVARAASDLQVHEKEIDAVLARNNAQAESFGFQGTPAFIIGTFRVPGVLDAAGFKQAVKDARSAAKAK